jgi:nitroimidazol reductase NimA-like FMN-containing flavoprotein (pyridoxamine 5'-phosphate oxidase superfamily)
VTREPADPSCEAERSELIARLRELLGDQRLAVLATSAADRPHGSLVAFAPTEDLKHILFATPRATRKYAHLVANPAVALVIDSRSNDEADFHNAMAVTATGRARDVEGQERDRLLSVYVAKHPGLRDFVTSPTCALVKVVIETYSTVTRFQNVVELRADELA